MLHSKLARYVMYLTLAITAHFSYSSNDIPPILGDYSNVVMGTDSDDQLYHGNGSDFLSGLAGNDQLFGLGGNDKLDGGAGNDYIDGGEGNDVQFGGADDDQLGGDTGNDWLSGGLGNDKYVVRPNNGQDTINNSTSDGIDWVIFSGGITIDKLSYYRVGDDLEIRIKDSTDTLTITKWFFDDSYQVDYIQPDTSTGISASQITAQAIVDDGSGDTGGGDSGGGDSGGGNTDGGDSDSDTNAHFEPPVTGNYKNEVTGTDEGEQLYFGNESDYLIGLGGDDQLFGLGGNDKLKGGDGNDYFNGAEGDDVQLGGSGDDQLGGDPGNDWLRGGLGNDKYVIRPGNGKDTINNSTSDGIDWILFTDSLTEDVLSYFQVGDNLEIRIENTEDTVTVLGWFLSQNNQVDYIQPSGKAGISAAQITQMATPDDTAPVENQAPHITSQPVITAIDNIAYYYKVEAEDPADNILFSLNTAPAGLIINQVSGEISWTPTIDQIGNHNVEVLVTDSEGLTDSQSFTLVVEKNDYPPKITSSPIETAIEITPYYYDVEAQDDENGLVFSLTQAPTGLTIDANTGEIKWTPTTEQIGEHNIQVVVTDTDGLTDTQNFTIVVAKKTYPPKITSTPPIQAFVSRGYDYNLVINDFDQKDNFEFFLLLSPTGMSIDKREGNIFWSPEESDIGDHIIKVQVKDDTGLTAEQTFNINVILNHSPKIISPPEIFSLSNQVYRYEVKAVDSDGDNLTYSLLEKPEGMTISGEGVINWLATQKSKESIEVQVSDTYGFKEIQSYVLITVDDTDFDGVNDQIDQCPDSVIDETVNDNGCTESQITQQKRLRNSKVPKTGSNQVLRAFDDASLNWGAERHYIQNPGDQYVVDQVNNLVWQDDIDTVNLKLNYPAATAYCDALELGGITDWYLPSRLQILFLLDYSKGNHNRALLDTAFQNVPESDRSDASYFDYWVSEVSHLILNGGAEYDVASQINIFTGKVNGRNGINHMYETSHVRCVSGNSTFKPEYELASTNYSVFRSDVSLIDNTNNIMWQLNKNDIDKSLFTWKEAINYCENIVHANANDWRLPNINELQSVSTEEDFQKYKYQYNGIRFLAGYKWDIWSTTPTISRSHVYSFGKDMTRFYRTLTISPTDDEKARVLCVRDFSKPKIILEVPTEITFGQNISLDASKSKSDDGEVIEFRWFNYLNKAHLSGAVITTRHFPVGMNEIQLTVKNNRGVQTKKTIFINVKPSSSNTKPVAYNKVFDFKATHKNVYPISLSGTDADGDNLIYEIIQKPKTGYLKTVEPYSDDFTFEYFSGEGTSDNIVFRIFDGQSYSDEAVITINTLGVVAVPHIERHSWYATEEDIPIDIVLEGYDRDGDSVTFSSLDKRIVINGNIATFTPFRNVAGIQEFNFYASDNKGNFGGAYIRVTVSQINDAPIAESKSFTVQQDELLNFILPAMDVDNTNISYQLLSQPQHGQLTLTENKVVYTPADNYVGRESFTYKASDGSLDSNIANITINILPPNSPPIAFDDNVKIKHEQSFLDITLQATDTFTKKLTFYLVGQPIHGRLEFTGNNSSSFFNTLRYFPNSKYSGNDSFTFKVNDGKLDSNIATISISTSDTNKAPIAISSNIELVEDVETNITLQANDENSDDLTYQLVTLPTYGQVVISDNNVVYTPSENYFGNDSFSFKANDSALNSNIAMVNLTIVPVNDEPNAQTQKIYLSGTTASVKFTLTATDPDSTALTYQVIDVSKYGQIEVVNNDVIYTKPPGFVGEDSITFKANDGMLDSENATIIFELWPGKVDDIVADAGEDISITVGEEVSFDATNSRAKKGIASYEWSLANDILSTEAIFTTTNLPVGINTVILKVTDMNGLEGSDEVQISVNYQLQQCEVKQVEDDSDYIDSYPEKNISWTGKNYTDVAEIEKAFNHARFIDQTINKYLKMPTQATWDAMSAQEQGLFLINSEREARGIKPYVGISTEIAEVAMQYAEHIRSNNEVITHTRSSDNASPTDRLNENAKIAANNEGTLESLAAYMGENSSGALVNAIYSWTYADKYPLSGVAWGHRSHNLYTQFLANSYSKFSEGLLGFGISVGDYDPTTNNPDKQGSVVVMNSLKPGESWDYSNTKIVDTRNAHQCADDLALTIDNSQVSLIGLKAITISPTNISLAINETESFTVTGLFEDGSEQDLSAGVSFIADERSVIAIEQGLITGKLAGKATVSARVGQLHSNRISVYVGVKTDTSNLVDNSAEQLLKHIPVNATKKQYDPKAVSIFTGLVLDKSGIGISGVNIAFHNKPELGSVLTDVEGRFIITAASGGQTLVYSKPNYLTVHRSTIAASNNWARLADVTLLALDNKKTAINLNSGEVQVHQSSMISDEFGSRATTLVFNDVTSATVWSKDGSSRQLSEFFVQATEYETPGSMPGNLPEESAFTYCSELQIPGVGDDENVVFNSPVVMYVDNFLEFSVGEIVPVGYFDRIDSKWKASENGVVVKLLDSNNDGVVDGLDYTGDNLADDINNNGSTSDEIAGIEGYSPGATYWRGAFNHFTPFDYNWPANTDGTYPVDINVQSEQEDPQDNECASVNSYIKPKSLSFHEDIAVAGTGLTLHYSSQRTHGYHHKISANVSGETIPDGVIEMLATLEIGGKRLVQSFAPDTLQNVEFIWDGTDVNGEVMHGASRGRLSIGYKYQAEYFSAGNIAESGLTLNSFATAWAQWGTDSLGIQSREDIIRWSVGVVTLFNAPISQIANGWSLSNHHVLGPNRLIYKGDGEVKEVNVQTNIFKTDITQSQYIGDDGYYQSAGRDIDYSVDEQGILTDHVTKLKWQYQPVNQVEFTSYPDAYQYCAALELGNEKNWRLPYRTEITYAVHKSAGNFDFPIYNMAANNFWFKGAVNQEKPTPVLCVSGERLFTIAHTYRVNNEVKQIQIDHKNGLMWQDTPSVVEDTFSWTDSLDMCESLEHAGFSNWRLPNINELKSAEFDISGFKYALDMAGFWSSTPNILDPENQAWLAWSLGSSPAESHNEKNLARCVRTDTTNSAVSPYIFDSSGKHIKTIDMTTGKTLTTFQYDQQGRLISLEDRFDNTISISRNAQGIATQITSPDGFVTKLTVDENHDLTRAEYDDGSAYTFAYIDSLMTEEMDPNGNQYDKVYSSIGRIEQTQDPEGGQWNFFNLQNKLTNVTSYGYTTAENNRYQSASSLLLNGDSKLVTTYADNSQREKITQADGLKESLNVSDTYSVIDKIIDEKTNQPIPHVITTTMPSGLKSVTQIDKTYGDNGTDTSKITVTVNSNNKVNTVFKNINTGEQINTTAGNRTINYMTDPQTQLHMSTQVSGLTASENQYDAKGRLISSSMGDRVTRYTYDDVNSKGGLTAITDAKGYSTYFEYDIMGRVIKTTYPDGGVLEQSYDFNGNMLSLTPPGQPEHRFNYNSVDNATAYTPPVVTTVDGQNEAEAVPAPATTYDYDKDRKLTKVTRPDGQIVSVNYTKGTDQVASMDIPRGTYSYSYDQHGKMTAVIAPDNSKVSYEYDGSLPISETLTGEINGTISQTFNNDFNVTQQCINSTNCIDYQYEHDGLVTAAGDLTISHEAQKGGIINGTKLINITSNFDHNTFAERQAETVDFNATQLFSVDYTRDKLGRITQKVEVVANTTKTTEYEYGLGGRLTQVKTDGNITATYGFGKNGNRTHIDGVEVATFDTQDRITSFKGNRYTYNENGELQSKTNTVINELTNYSYDVLGNLLAVNIPDEGSSENRVNIDYIVDGLNRRIGKKVNGVLIKGWLYQGQLNPVAELDASNNIVSRFVYADRVNIPSYMIKGGKTYRIIPDHLGSPRLVVNAETGEIAQALEYDVWGNITSDTNPDFQPFGFAGGLYDRDTKLTRFGARDYDAEIGRWTSKDPIRFAGGDSNIYGYVLGDPVNYFDPNGLKRQIHFIRGIPSDGKPYYSIAGNHGFYTPQHANFYSVLAAGKETGKLNLLSRWNQINTDVGHFGTFDFQREAQGSSTDFYFILAFTDSSNYAVGVYMFGAGYSISEMNSIAGGFANLLSSNSGDQIQKTMWEAGWKDAKNGNLKFTNSCPSK
ncbi:Ig-like domain-containing protein [Pseudoalteromonas denitrificans]|uniref:RHS repeat-associated core domain-containing protein n=1 Tax=Pseudoalteromonas denitrificans DSM 6059 TaxID=1123010 RepID=A0A1I1T4Z8_9GAMM|nr:Ig-like domain-containing protein [Pseudoalteromonas denitrificans]SFD53815.1 RHS repeat-associated core domain-containing protein [Pseudoalteromonas denitrificans DSM 6059]